MKLKPCVSDKEMTECFENCLIPWGKRQLISCAFIRFWVLPQQLLSFNIIGSKLLLAEKIKTEEIGGEKNVNRKRVSESR